MESLFGLRSGFLCEACVYQLNSGVRKSKVPLQEICFLNFSQVLDLFFVELKVAIQDPKQFPFEQLPKQRCACHFETGVPADEVHESVVVYLVRIHVPRMLKRHAQHLLQAQVPVDLLDIQTLSHPVQSLSVVVGFQCQHDGREVVSDELHIHQVMTHTGQTATHAGNVFRVLFSALFDNLDQEKHIV